MNAPSLPPLEPQTQLTTALPDEPVVPLSVEGYHVLLQAGILQDGDPIELLEGFMVLKMPRGPRHEFARRRLLRLQSRMSLSSAATKMTTWTTTPAPKTPC